MLIINKKNTKKLSMEADLKNKIKKAQNLRKKPKFPLSLFASPDYITAGDLFCEVAKECTIIEEKVRYYKEAANTYLLKNEEYNIYLASEQYKNIFNTLKDYSFPESVEFCIKQAECLYKIEKYMICGQTYMTLAEMVRKCDEHKAMEIFRKAKEAFKLDGKCPYHLKKAVEECLILDLKNNNIKEAIEAFEILDSKFHAKYSRLSKHILYFLDRKSEYGNLLLEEALPTEESSLMMALSNKNGDESAKILKQFSADNVLPEIVSLVFNLAIDRLTGCDIC